MSEMKNYLDLTVFYGLVEQMVQTAYQTFQYIYDIFV